MPIMTDLWDPTLDVASANETEAEVIARFREHARYSALVAIAVVGYKRRLGDVDTALLAQDKKLARRVASALQEIVTAADGEREDWNEFKTQVEPQHKQEAAVLRWEVWLPAVIKDTQLQVAWGACWVVKIDMQAKHLKRLVARMDAMTTRLVSLNAEHATP